MARTRLTKRLSYRDLSGASEAAHVAHWRGFRWDAGPWVVSCFGPWGEVKVWASSADEGKRVIRHAGSIAGVNPDDPAVCSWFVYRTASTRLGRTGTMETRVRRGYVQVSKRNGSSGAPTAYPA